MKTYKAPEAIEKTEGKIIFLAGTIDMGDSNNWQERVTKFFENKVYTILNPRRDDWDNTWTQSIDNEQFCEQVYWEMDAMEKADIIIMNFLEHSKSPVTMIEFGLYAASGKLKVCCPNSFWRSGNIHIVCKRYGIPLFKDIDTLLKEI